MRRCIRCGLLPVPMKGVPLVKGLCWYCRNNIKPAPKKKDG